MAVSLRGDEDPRMIITSERIILAVAAFGVFMYVQRKQRKMSDKFLQNLQQRRDGRPDDKDAYVDMRGSADADADDESSPDKESENK